MDRDAGGSPVVERMPIVLSGHGLVGQAFVDHLAAARAEIGRRHGVGLDVVAIRARSAQCLLDGSAVPARSAWQPLENLDDLLERTTARVLVQAVPSSVKARSQAADEAITALRRGVHVVTATKSHLLSHWSELQRAAEAGRSLIRISAATGAALPAADLARTGVRGLGCTTIRACPNGTATFVLDRLAAGTAPADAVREAQVRGIAEADPTADLSGQDAGTKLRLLAALAWGWDPAATTVQAQAIDADTAKAARDAAAAGSRLRAVATATLLQPLRVRVVLEATMPGDPLYALRGPEKAVVFGCPDAGEITVAGGRSSPLGAALALTKDAIATATAGRSGFG